MMRQTRRNGAILAIVAVAICACDTGQLSRKITGPGGGDAAIAVQLGNPAGLPGGTYFVAHPGDLWARGTGLLGFFSSQNAFRTRAWVLEGKLRNATNDPRLPAIASTTAAWGSFAVMGTAAFADLAGSAYDLYAAIVGLQPNTDYTVMLVRYGLEVRGALDALNVILGQPADAPDSLFVLDGTPGGNPDYLCDFGKTDVPTVAADVNPFVVGYFTTNSAGTDTIDCVIDGGGIWDADDDNIIADQAVVPFGGNRFAPFGLPAYNYLVIVEGRGSAGNPVPAGPTVARVQMGVDLDASGNPIRDGMAPFPVTALPTPTLVELRFRNANPLASGLTYQFWAVNNTTGAASRIVGDVRHYDATGGTVLDSALAVSEIAAGGGLNELYVFRADMLSTDVDFADFDEVRVTVGPSGAAQPSDVRFVHAKYITQAGDLYGGVQSSGALAFGGGYTYGGSGEAFFFGDELRFRFTNLPAPPRGYFYEVWLVGDEPLSLGPILSPYPEYASLRDADQTMERGQFISSAALVINRADMGLSFGDFASMLVTLTPKDGAPGTIPLHAAMQAAIPVAVVQEEQQ